MSGHSHVSGGNHENFNGRTSNTPSNGASAHPAAKADRGANKKRRRASSGLAILRVVEQLESRTMLSVGGGFTAGGVTGDYFNNTALTGSPSFTRRDVRIDFDWGTTAAPGGSISPGFRDIGTDNYSVRWTGQVIPRFSETYTFKTTSDDGVRLYIKQAGTSTWTTLVDNWVAHTATDNTGTFAMVAGQAYDIRMEYYEGTGAAVAKLKWSSPSTPEETIDPAVETGINNPDWTAGYTDIVKGARNSWEPVDGGARPTMDAQGWPQGNGAYVFQESLNQGLDVDPLMRGKVAFSFNGRADVSLQGNVDSSTLTSSYNAANNTTTGSFTVKNNGWNATYFYFRNSDRDGIQTGGVWQNDGITNFRLMRPTGVDATTAYPTTGTTTAPDADLFTPQLRDAMTKFTVIRHQLVANQQKNWSDRTRPDYFNQSGGTTTTAYYGIGDPSNNGASWEYKVMLANETGSDLMISIPTVATVDPNDPSSYVYKLAQLIKFGADANGNPYTTPTANPVYPPLNPNLRVHLEIANELWNYDGIFGVDFNNINKITSADVDANNADYQAFNYDNQPLTKNANGDYTSIDTWRYRKIMQLLLKTSDTFRNVWGGSAINDKVRVLYEWQYANDNDTARKALTFADKYYNNADGITHVATPRPVNSWLWGGGGATYYGAVNGNGLTTLNPNAGFENTTVPAGINQNPAGSGYTFTGTAGIARYTAGNALGIPAPYDGSQLGYVQDDGAISFNVTFPSNFVSNVFAFNFRAHNRLKNGASAGDTENLRVYLDDTTDITARTFSQGNGYTPPDITQIAPWLSRNVYWTTSQYYYTKTFTVTPGQTRKITIKGTNLAGSNMMAFLEDLRVTSVDRIFQDGMPGGGEATGQPVGQGIRNTMNTEVNWAQAYGLQTLAYEAGWSLGGDDGGSPLQLQAKYKDSRTAGVQGTFMDFFHQAGGAVNVHGTYAQWPSWSDFFAEQGLANVSSYPIIQGITGRSNQLKPEATNGLLASAVLTPALSNISDNANTSLGQIGAAGGWMNWNVLVPKTGSYSLSALTSGTGTAVLLVDNNQLVSGAAGSTISGTITLTRGLHSIKLRNVSTTSFTVNNVSISGTGAPAAPTLSSASDSNASVALSWSAVTGATGYIVRYGTKSGVYDTRVDVGNVLSQTITGLTNNSQYFFTITAYNASGESLPSNERGAIPFADGTNASIAQWEFSGVPGTPISPTSLTPNSATSRLTFSALSRNNTATGLRPSDSGSYDYFRAGRFASEASNNVYGSTLADSISRGQYYQFTVQPGSGRNMSLASLSFIPTFQNQNANLGAGLTYSVDGVNFSTAAVIPLPNNTNPGPQTVSLSSIAALQNTTATVTFRIYLYGCGAYEVTGLGGGSNDSNTDVGLVGTTNVLATVPAAPSGLGASASSPTTVNLTWTDNSTNETGFKVERATNSAFTTGLTLLTTTAAAATSYTDSTASPATTYYYRVRATNAAGDSANSNTATVTTPSVPAAPSNLSATATSTTTVSLTWTDNSTNETGFKVERAANSIFTTGLTLLTTTAASVTTYTDTTAAASTTYYYRVRATNVYGDSANSNTATVTTPAPSIGIFSASTNIGGATPAGSASFNSTTSTYTLVGGGADIWGTSDQFQLVSADRSGDFSLTARVASLQNTNSWAKAGVMIRDGTAANAIHAMVVLTPGNGVAFQWRSSTGGASSNTNVASVSAPQYVRISRTGTSIKAEYSANGTTWTQIGTTQNITFPTAVKAGLAVTSHSQGTGCTATFDNVAFASIGAPAAPTALSATSLYPTRVSLAWTDNSSNETGFKVERATNSTFTTGLTLLTTTAASVTTYDDNTVSGSTAYYYRVRATNASGDSPNSNTATVTTPAPQSTLAEDTFNGTAGPLNGVSTGTGWSGGWSVQNDNTTSYTLATSPALSYSTLNVGSGLARGGGSYLTVGRSINTTAFTGYTRDANNNITGQAASGSGVLYFSVLLRNDSNTSADIIAGLNNSGVSWNPAGSVALEVGQFGGVPQWGIRNSAGTVSRSTVAVTQGATTLLVVKVDWTNNLASLYVNPTQLGAAEPSTPSATIAIPAMYFRQFHFYGGNSVNDSSLGAIRLGARYLDVTPTQSGQIQGMSLRTLSPSFSSTPVQLTSGSSTQPTKKTSSVLRSWLSSIPSPIA